MKLIDAIRLNGQPFFFHSVAAYLNSIYVDDFQYTTSQVINLVRSAGSPTNDNAGVFSSANEQGQCPLGGGPATRP
jgi:hypothetical protein